MSIKQPKILNPYEISDEITERKLLLPFKSEKKIKGHSEGVCDITVATFLDGQKRIISCSSDKTIRIFNIEENKCEKIIKHSATIFSVHYYEEEQVLMTTDWNGELNIFKLFPEIKIIKKIRVTEQESTLWRITQISQTDFLCCVGYGFLRMGCLYKINFNKNNNENNWNSEEIEYPTQKN